MMGGIAVPAVNSGGQTAGQEGEWGESHRGFALGRLRFTSGKEASVPPGRRMIWSSQLPSMFLWPLLSKVLLFSSRGKENS